MFLFFIFCNPAHSIQSMLLDMADKLPVEIHFVTTCGQWKRPVWVLSTDYWKGYNGVGSQAYVKWIVEAMEGTPRKVLNTLAFSGSTMTTQSRSLF